jgi:hypothetical protein
MSRANVHDRKSGATPMSLAIERLAVRAAAGDTSSRKKKGHLMGNQENSVTLVLDEPQTFQLGGTGLDNVEDVNVGSSDSSITWTASITGKSSTTLEVVATPSLVVGGEIPTQDDQVLISPVGSGYSLSDNFLLNGIGPIQCTITSSGTVYTNSQQLSLVAKYSVGD